MKKLFSIVSIIALTFAITGCTEEPPTCDEGYALVDGECELEEITCEEGYILEDEVCILDERINLDFVFVDFDGTETMSEVVLDDEFEGTFTDVLLQEFDADVLPSDYGNLLLTIEELTPLMGSYIAVMKNDEMSMVGIDEITYEDGDEFSFELIWWDVTAEAVYDAIDLFMEQQVDNYVNAEFIDYNVFAALDLLGVTEEYISDAEVEAYLAATYPEPTSYAEYFKILSIKTSAGLNTDVEGEELLMISETGVYGQTALTLLGTHMNDQSKGAFDDAAIEYFNSYPATLADLDGGGLDLIAYSLLGSDMITEKHEDFYAQIVNSQLASGGIKTEDVVWDGVTYPGTENAASMSMVILGLLANGYNPAGLDLTSEDSNSLISRLVEFQTETGTFDWVLDDEMTEDTIFSTPQAFLALVAYHTYINTMEPVNPYN